MWEMASKVAHLLIVGALLALPCVSSNLVQLHDASDADARSVFQDPVLSPTSFEGSNVADSAVRHGSDHDLPHPVPWVPWWAHDGGKPIDSVTTGMTLVGMQPAPQDTSWNHEAAMHSEAHHKRNLLPDTRQTQTPSALETAQDRDSPVDTLNSDLLIGEEASLRLMNVKSTTNRSEKSKNSIRHKRNYSFNQQQEPAGETTGSVVTAPEEVTISPQELPGQATPLIPPEDMPALSPYGVLTLLMAPSNSEPTTRKEKKKGEKRKLETTTPMPEIDEVPVTLNPEEMEGDLENLMELFERDSSKNAAPEATGSVVVVTAPEEVTISPQELPDPTPRVQLCSSPPSTLTQPDRKTPDSDGNHILPANLPYSFQYPPYAQYPLYPQYPPYYQYMKHPFFPLYPYQYGSGVPIRVLPALPIPYVHPLAYITPDTYPSTLSTSIRQASWFPASSWSTQLSQSGQPVASQYTDVPAASSQSQVQTAPPQVQPWPWTHYLVPIPIFASTTAALPNDSKPDH